MSCDFVKKLLGGNMKFIKIENVIFMKDKIISIQQSTDALYVYMDGQEKLVAIFFDSASDAIDRLDEILNELNGVGFTNNLKPLT